MRSGAGRGGGQAPPNLTSFAQAKVSGVLAAAAATARPRGPPTPGAAGAGAAALQGRPPTSAKPGSISTPDLATIGKPHEGGAFVKGAPPPSAGSREEAGRGVGKGLGKGGKKGSIYLWIFRLDYIDFHQGTIQLLQRWQSHRKGRTR